MEEQSMHEGVICTLWQVCNNYTPGEDMHVYGVLAAGEFRGSENDISLPNYVQVCRVHHYGSLASTVHHPLIDIYS